MKTIVKKSLRLPDGSEIVLTDMSSPDKSVPDFEVEQNVFKIDADGNKLWQIKPAPPVRPRTPFTNIYFSPAGTLRAFRFDCYEHEIDIDTGEAKIVDYLK